MPAHRIDVAFAAEQREKFKPAFATLTETLPFLVDLTAQERADMAKFGIDVDFWKAAIAFFTPSKLSMARFRARRGIHPVATFGR